MTTPDVELRDARLRIGGRTWSRKEVQRAVAEQIGVRIRVPLVLGASSGMVAIPAAITLFSRADAGAPGLAVPALAAAATVFFLCLGWLMSAGSRYALVLQTPRGPVRAFICADHQLVISLVAQVNDQLACSRHSEPIG